MAIVTSRYIRDRCIEEFKERNDSLRNPSYLPRDASHQVMREDDNVKATIEKYVRPSTIEEKRNLLEYARKNPHVFLTLASSRLVKKIKTLWEAHVKDCHLPVRLQYDETTGRRQMVSLEDPAYEAKLSPNAFVEGDDEEDESKWDLADLTHFVTEQWRFYAVIFDTTRFLYEGLSDKRPLPFIEISTGAAGSGNFGKVFKVGLRREHVVPNHTEFQYLRLIQGPSNSEQILEVAVKQLQRVNGASDEEILKFFEKEATTLKTMRTLADPHLIQAIAVYERGSERCILFPWAPNGNLRQLWLGNLNPSSQEVRRWAWEQILGLTRGLARLHETNTRHGDLKPENILRFKGSTGSAWGPLLIADVGIAKYHAFETEVRKNKNEATTNRTGTQRYTPPEIEVPEKDDNGKLRLISRKYDSWSLGCVLLEFITWLRRGRSGLSKLDTERRRDAKPDVDRYWEQYGNDAPILHPGVSGFIRELLADPRLPAALRDLLALVKKHLLVASLKRRSYIATFLKSLEGVSENCSNIPSYLWDEAMEALTESREPTAEVARVDTFPISQQYVSSGLVYPFDLPVISLCFDPVSGAVPPSLPFALSGLPLLPEQGSAEQFSLLKSIMHHCDLRHGCMKPQEDSKSRTESPTRLIDVGTDGNEPIRLLETNQEQQYRYIALSHCWGQMSDDQRFCTYESNLEQRMANIPYDRMPPTFRDAVRVTRALGVRYLWIDSLCIIQKNAADWRTESGKMEDVFNNAYCTIAASSASSSLEGFLGPRPPRDTIRLATSSGPFYLAEAIDDFATDVEKSILSSRGWVFQERALSRRTIFFTSTQVYWECGDGVICESLAQLRNPQSHFLGDSNFPLFALQFYKDERTRLLQHFYTTYSALALSRESDRPQAIAGLQRRIARIFNSDVDHGVFWRWPARTLLWCAAQPGSLASIHYDDDGAKPPSWSWMAYSGRVGYLDIDFGGVEWTKYGRGPPDAPDWALQVEARELRVDGAVLKQRAVLDTESPGALDDSWRCVVLGKEDMGRDGNDDAYYVLLIRPLTRHSLSLRPDQLEEYYERVGVATLLGSNLLAEEKPVFLI
ncbi:hypothetical protein FJTKL_15438 [Diaporthe vaccinii]|uniref:Protein kinase domain-containing protein n=1 Tax=Diaporthe vaccinii TaxID=105482 RepID=A0ABR4E518_9PEZI